MTRILRTWRTTLVLVLILAAALALPKCEGKGSHPFTRAPAVTTAAARQAAAACSRAYGQCQVTEFIHIRANGTEWIETCLAAPPATEGHGGILVAVDYCYRP